MFAYWGWDAPNRLSITATANPIEYLAVEPEPVSENSVP